MRNSANGLFIYLLLQAHQLHPSHLHPTPPITHKVGWFDFSNFVARWMGFEFFSWFCQLFSRQPKLISHLFLDSISSSEQTGMVITHRLLWEANEIPNSEHLAQCLEQSRCSRHICVLAFHWVNCHWQNWQKKKKKNWPGISVSN